MSMEKAAEYIGKANANKVFGDMEDIPIITKYIDEEQVHIIKGDNYCAVIFDPVY